jgi:hypothetical protein
VAGGLGDSLASGNLTGWLWQAAHGMNRTVTVCDGGFGGEL